MAQKSVNAARNSGMESLEERQMFSTYGTVNIALTAITPSAQVDYTRNGVDQTWSAGKFIWSRSATDPGSYVNKAVATTLETFCIEPDQDVTTPSVNYTVSDLTSGSCSNSGPLSTAKASAIRELWGRFHASIGNEATKAAAFQMAIWELVCDGDKNLSTGTFSVDDTTATDVAVKAQAQCMLNQLTGCGPKADLLALTSPTDQDQIFEVGCTPCTPCYTQDWDCHEQYHCVLRDHHDCLNQKDNNQDHHDCLNNKDNDVCLGGFHYGGTCPSFTIHASGSDCHTLSLCGGR